VGFIGAYERERAESILFLAKNGVSIRVWGQGWNKKNYLSHPNIKIENMPLWGEDYAKAICSFGINLNFLRRVNRDLQTTRSIEIPACGGFMLAERTDEHLRLFDEGKEAEFFDSDEELLDKVRYYLAHEDELRLIARAGRERCLKGGYSYQERMGKLFLQLGYLLG
jgi:spore maturation protein CgeB